MKIKYGVQLLPDALLNEEIDLFILAGNHEKRVFTAYDFVKKANKITKSLLLCYKDYVCDKKYKNIEKHVISDYTDIFTLLDESLKVINKTEVTIFIDYSCMTKSWYYGLMLYLSNKQNIFKSIKTYFSYTPSKFSIPQEPKHNTDIAPLPGKYVVPTDKPKALIVCLGYEQNKAEGIINHLDPKIYHVFYTNPALDKRFVSVLKNNNEYILKNSKYITEYSFDDLLFLERELTSLYFSLRDDYSVIIAPLGPKPFTFISMLLSVKYHDIDIWRVGSGSDINLYPREPIAKDCFIFTQILWSNE